MSFPYTPQDIRERLAACDPPPAAETGDYNITADTLTALGAFAIRVAKKFPDMADILATEIMSKAREFHVVPFTQGCVETHVEFHSPHDDDDICCCVFPGTWYPDSVLFLDVLYMLAEGE